MTAVLRDDTGPTALSIAQQEMRSGERLIWADRPAAGRMAILGLPLTLFGLPFTGFALFWMLMAGSMSTADEGLLARLFPLFGLPFLLIGLGMVLSPLWGWIGARRTIYAVSSDRAVIIKGGSVRSFEPDEIEDLERYQRSDGSGDVVFHREAAPSGRRSRRSNSMRRIGFYGIPEVRRVEDELRRLKDRAGE